MYAIKDIQNTTEQDKSWAQSAHLGSGLLGLFIGVDMKLIKLTQDYWAMVDDEDYGYLMQWKWYANKDRKTHYAVRSQCTAPKTFTKLRMHRVITACPANLQVDHINHNGLDNRRHNLRTCSLVQNLYNRRQPTTSKHGYRGVFKSSHCNSYQAVITYTYKHIGLGSYPTARLAAAVYDEAAKKYFGEFAIPNLQE